MTVDFNRVECSLRDLLGDEYVEAVCRARSLVSGKSMTEWLACIDAKVAFLPQRMQSRQAELLEMVGRRVIPPLEHGGAGSGSAGFAAVRNRQLAPLTGYGCFRVGEDGRLFLITKSEHYHAPLGHSFPGFRLLEHARRLGIPNATHNNTTGYITRLLEEELARAACAVNSCGLSRVLNLQTGSLVAEAALKAVLSRFFRPEDNSPEPKYAGRIPVLLVLGNAAGDLQGNYHGTTTLAQMLRGMWPSLTEAMCRGRLLKVHALRPNNMADLEDAFTRFESPPYKIAGFFHEIIMMNYAAVRLSEQYLGRAYELCAGSDVATVLDEIQTCAWSPRLFIFREYDLDPDIVAVGKGFSGGEYAASRLLIKEAWDQLPQFGALVTNGQEEIASLAYLIVMRWLAENAETVAELGDYFESGLRDIAAESAGVLTDVNGRRHLAGLCFQDVTVAKTFTGLLNERGLDMSVQAYKSDCPPAALVKVPVTADRKVLNFILRRIREALGSL